MDILTDVSTKRTIVAALIDNAEGQRFHELLCEIFDVILCRTAEECLGLMTERHFELSAAIVDIELAKADDYAFLRTVSSNSDFNTTPVLVTTTSPDISDEDALCLKLGAADIMMKPCHPMIVWKRVENAVRAVSSATFVEIEKMLCQLPSMIFLKDAEGRYVFSTQYHQYQKADDPNWTIHGKTDVEIREDKENAIAAMEADREIIRTKKGSSYVINFIDEFGKPKSMELIKQPVFDNDGNVMGIIALGNDVTENEMLKRELRTRALTDDMTGFGNHRALEEYITETCQHVEYPLAIISADCDNLKKVNDTFGHLVGDDYICIAASILRDNLPEDSAKFRAGGDEFVVFMPGVTQEHAQRVLEEVRGHEDEFKKIGEGFGMSYGMTVAECPDDVLTVLADADRMMYLDKAIRKRGRA